MRQLSKTVRAVLLLGTSASLSMCSSDSDKPAQPDASTPVDSGTSPGVDAGIDSGLGATPDAAVDAASLDAATVDAANLDAGSDASSSDASLDAATPAPWHLWVMESTSGHLYGYAPRQLTATNGDAPEIDIALADNLGSLHFDSAGNLWGAALTTTVVKYAANDLKQSGSATASVKFTETTIGNVTYVNFDKAGNLWTTGYNAHPISRYDASSLTGLTATSPPQTPAFMLTRSAPSEIAFDSAGNLYATVNPGGGAANAGRFDASQLVGTGSVGDPAAALLANLTFYASTFFSPSGQLVFSCESDKVYRLSAAQLAVTGNTNSNATPETIFTITNLNGGWGAYDPNGVLWISGRADHFVALSAADLAKTGAVTVTTPAVTLRAPVTNPTARFTSIAIH